MKNKENHGEKELYIVVFKHVIYPQCQNGVRVVEFRCTVTGHKIPSQTSVTLGVLNTAYRYQQSHSVALPKLLFGHNYRGFVGTIEWLL